MKIEFIEEYKVINNINIPYNRWNFTNDIYSSFNHVECKINDIIRIIYLNPNVKPNENDFFIDINYNYIIIYKNCLIPLYFLIETLKINTFFFQLIHTYYNIKYIEKKDIYFNIERVNYTIYENNNYLLDLFCWDNISINDMFKLERKLKLKSIL